MTDLASDELALLQRQIREFGHFRLSAADLAPIHAAADAFRTYLRNKGGGEPLRQAVAVLAHWRNARAHDMAPAAPEPQRPAYSLDEAELA
ncbi:hypothetical protein STAQ_39110 [Allostella sp. ATCC 35155]|nr:hypothetical protein STAQ_39110 [Stella sp. ATCC 35155]